MPQECQESVLRLALVLIQFQPSQPQGDPCLILQDQGSNRPSHPPQVTQHSVNLW